MGRKPFLEDPNDEPKTFVVRFLQVTKAAAAPAEKAHWQCMELILTFSKISYFLNIQSKAKI